MKRVWKKIFVFAFLFSVLMVFFGINAWAHSQDHNCPFRFFSGETCAPGGNLSLFSFHHISEIQKTQISAAVSAVTGAVFLAFAFWLLGAGLTQKHTSFLRVPLFLLQKGFKIYARTYRWFSLHNKTGGTVIAFT